MRELLFVTVRPEFGVAVRDMDVVATALRDGADVTVSVRMPVVDAR